MGSFSCPPTGVRRKSTEKGRATPLLIATPRTRSTVGTAPVRSASRSCSPRGAGRPRQCPGTRGARRASSTLSLWTPATSCWRSPALSAAMSRVAPDYVDIVDGRREQHLQLGIGRGRIRDAHQIRRRPYTESAFCTAVASMPFHLPLMRTHQPDRSGIWCPRFAPSNALTSTSVLPDPENAV